MTVALGEYFGRLTTESHLVQGSRTTKGAKTLLADTTLRVICLVLTSCYRPM